MTTELSLTLHHDKGGDPIVLSLSMDGVHFPPIGGTVSVGEYHFPIVNVDWDITENAVKVFLEERTETAETIDAISSLLFNEGWDKNDRLQPPPPSTRHPGFYRRRG